MLQPPERCLSRQAGIVQCCPCTNLLPNKISVFLRRTAIEAAGGNNCNIAERYLTLVADQIAFFGAVVLKCAVFHFVDFFPVITLQSRSNSTQADPCAFTTQTKNLQSEICT